jgi:uncharacterized protein (DUF1330 family)
MPAYLIVNYKLENPELYGEYAQAAGPAIKIGTEAELLALDPATEQLEGEPAGHQTVILRFESKARAKELYQSGEYQAIIGKRLEATSNHFAILVEGVPG